MPQAVVDEGAYIVGGNMVAPIQPGVCARNLIEGQRAAWAGADVNPALQVFTELLGATRGGDERDDITFHGLGHNDLMNLLTGLEDRLLWGYLNLRQSLRRAPFPHRTPGASL